MTLKTARRIFVAGHWLTVAFVVWHYGWCAALFMFLAEFCEYAAFHPLMQDTKEGDDV